ncbi:hypothetical protein ABBQ32_001493 [Trebouxia sp. C0010 RCD-2024]
MVFLGVSCWPSSEFRSEMSKIVTLSRSSEQLNCCRQGLPPAQMLNTTTQQGAQRCAAHGFQIARKAWTSTTYGGCLACYKTSNIPRSHCARHRLHHDTGCRLETDTNMVMRFIIGQTLDQAQDADLVAEANQYGGFMRLHLQEQYNSLTNKTVAFLRAVTSHYSPRYIVKADDDVYLRVDRLPYAIKQWTAFNSDYIGCMKTGQIMTSPEWRWYEPQHAVLGSKQYFTHAWGSIYVLSGTAASSIAQMPSRMRYFANEDVTLGAWMLALDVNHFDDRRLCDPWCTPSSLAVYNIPECSGLCNPVDDLLHLYAQEDCRSQTASDGSVPLLPPIFSFKQ